MPSSDSLYHIKMVNALFLALPGGVIEKVEHYSLAWFILIFPKKKLQHREYSHHKTHCSYILFKVESNGENTA